MTTAQHTQWTMRMYLNTAEDEAFAKENGVKMTMIPALTSDGSRIISGPDGGHVAYVLPTTKPKRGEAYKHVDAERDARGHLIAAAPQLLAACKAAEKVLAAMQETDRGYIVAEELGMIRAAIAKAEGKDAAQ